MEDNNGIPDVDNSLLRHEIIEELEKFDENKRDMASQMGLIAKLLEDSENKSIRNDRIGTAFVIGGSIITGVTVLLASFTGGLSLLVVSTGLIAAVVGTKQIEAANRSARVLKRETLKHLDQIWQKHVEQIEKFNSSYPPNLIRAAKMQSKLNVLVTRSHENGMQLIAALLTSKTGEGDGANIDEILQNTDPIIKEWIGSWFSYKSPGCWQKVAMPLIILLFKTFLSMMSDRTRMGMQVIRAIDEYCMPFVGVVYGTSAASIFAWAACHMCSIWNPPEETEIVQVLRKMADDVEIRDQPVSIQQKFTVGKSGDTELIEKKQPSHYVANNYVLESRLK